MVIFMLYTTEFEARVRDWAGNQMPGDRFDHVRGVVETVDWMARQYAPDQIMQARLAAWIHDCAKHLSDDELLQWAIVYNLPITETERLMPDLLHGAVGYALANKEFGFDDPQLRTACAYHTTGAPGMNMLDKIVMLGDLIEPGRDFEGVQELRDLTKLDLDKAVLKSLDHTLYHLIDRRRIIDPRPVLLRNELLLANVRYD